MGGVVYPGQPQIPVSGAFYAPFVLMMRDYFAASAMSSILSNSAIPLEPDPQVAELVARTAYTYADAMVRHKALTQDAAMQVLRDVCQPPHDTESDPGQGRIIA